MRRIAHILFLSVLVLGFVAAGCSDDDDDNPTTPPASKAAIGILHDDSTHVAMIAYLEAEGYDVTNLGFYDEHDGSGLDDIDLLVMLNGYDYGSDLPDTVQQAYLDFMTGGGTMVFTEWFLYDENNEMLSEVNPLAYTDDYCDDGEGACIDTLSVDVVHELTNGLPNTFTTPDDYTYSFLILNEDATSTNAQVLISGVIGGAMLGVADLGQGHCIHWNNGGVYDGEDIWDANTLMILENIVDFAK
jgi:hypothetical protein